MTMMSRRINALQDNKLRVAVLAWRRWLIRVFLLALFLSVHCGWPALVTAVRDNVDEKGCPLHCSCEDDAYRPVPGRNSSSSINQSVPSNVTAGDSVRIFYLVLVHNERTINDAVHLVRAIRSSRNIILIHVDAKASNVTTGEGAARLRQEMANCCPRCNSTIRIESVYNVEWSKWSMNLPTLWGIELAVTEYADQWDVFINLSGDTLPVYEPNAMAQILGQLPYNFVTSSSCETGLTPTSVYLFPRWWHKRKHYLRDETEPDPTFHYQEKDDKNEWTWKDLTITTHFGSQWVILQAWFCQWLVKELNRTTSAPSLYREYLIESGKLMTDETFLPSLIMNIPRVNSSLPQVDERTGQLVWKNGSLSTITNIRYERMDEHSPSAFGVFPQTQRYQVPPNSTTGVEQTRPWGPYYLGVYDLHSIRTSGALFARKISQLIDPNMIRLLPIRHANDIPHIAWPEHVSISDKPQWDPELEEAFRDYYHHRPQQQRRSAGGSSPIDDDDDDEEL